MVLASIPASPHIGERAPYCANQHAADKGFEPMTSRTRRVYYTNHQGASLSRTGVLTSCNRSLYR